jgi:hypothetical protein
MLGIRRWRARVGARGHLRRGVDSQLKFITSLAVMRDEQLACIAQTQGRTSVAPFFFGECRPSLVAALLRRCHAYNTATTRSGQLHLR